MQVYVGICTTTWTNGSKKLQIELSKKTLKVLQAYIPSNNSIQTLEYFSHTDHVCLINIKTDIGDQIDAMALKERSQ